MFYLCALRFICDFVDELPDNIFSRLPHVIQASFGQLTSTSLAPPCRPRAQYYLMAVHTMSLVSALAMFQVLPRREVFK